MVPFRDKGEVWAGFHFIPPFHTTMSCASMALSRHINPVRLPFSCLLSCLHKGEEGGGGGGLCGKWGGGQGMKGTWVV